MLQIGNIGALHQDTSFRLNPAISTNVQENIFDLVARHAFIQGECDRAIQRQEDLRRRFYRTQDQDLNGQPYFAQHSNDELQGGVLQREAGVLHPRNQSRISDLSRQDARQRLGLAADNVPEGLSNARRRFALNALGPEMRELREIEGEIAILRMAMTDIEETILDHKPAALGEAMSKLSFLSGMMLDGRVFDQHDLGYILDECAAAVLEFMKK